MSFEFVSPVWLATLCLLPVLVHYYRRSLVDSSLWQRRVSLGVRSAIALLLSFALAGLTLLSPTKKVFVVFAVDESLSVAQESRAVAQKFVEESTRGQSAEHYSILPFASQPQSFTKTLPSDDRISNQPGPNQEAEAIRRRATNLQAALETAVAGIPAHYVPRIVLMSDGNETLGNGLQAAAQARVRIDTLPLPVRSDPELQVAEVSVPAQVAQGEPFFVEVVVNSNHDDEAVIEVFKAEHRVVSSRRPLTKGENRFKFTEQVDRPTEFSARIRRPVDGAGQPVENTFKDTLLDNNAASGLVFTAGKPRVLLIDPQPEQSQGLEWALKEEGLIVEVRPAAGIPEELAELQNFDVLAFSNVAATELSQRKIEIIRTYVSELGGGFVMLGGDQSFGLGGYFKTALEEVLPVRPDLEKDKEKPSLAMIVAIDKSGSMGGQKMALAKDAAKAAVEVLTERDQIGIIGFDAQPHWVSEVRPLTQKGLILDRISTLEAGGGTSLLPAMENAFNALQATNARLKHIIILTDGFSAPGDFDNLTRSMTAARITVSTVGIGEPDSNLLQRIAELGNGRYYFTNDPTSVPQIFTKETMQASKSAINEEPFLPQVVRASAVLSDLRLDEAPLLLGYVVTRPKATSEVILATENGDPLLSWWRYGLGMSVAFTSDAKARWAAEWQQWPGFSKFWSQVMRHAMRKSESKGFMVNVVRQGDAATVEVDAFDDSGQLLNGADTNLKLLAPNLSERQVQLPQVAPGRYSAKLDLRDPGAWHMLIGQSKDRIPLHQQSRGVMVGYPDELRLRPINEELLKAIAQISGGTFQPAPADVFRNESQTASNVTPLWPLLLKIALLLFVLDVALRRLDFGWLYPVRR